VGYLGGSLLHASLLLALVVIAYFFSRISRTLLFWSAFVLTRPLGAVVGDYLDKPVADGGLEFSRYTATGVLLAAIVLLIMMLPQRAADRAH